ncbi:hypothetical protein CEPID_01285 [Corynebacterium epidermidicanis]|uniref:Uncharacterized protein n=1 Tax=Corynebacterium epidermidicanis TaxID=1050174 RepID=A0A0G3GM05_9CORY|nr:hypothetical protein CEPID_01285 [Corynebacterium epidermidicanis]
MWLEIARFVPLVGIGRAIFRVLVLVNRDIFTMLIVLIAYWRKSR